ncbi:hypothetical protein NUG23_31790, partial [Streptomyces sp. PAL114]|nr:hypothetical protein [Streptomyces sp. PAL114]
VAGFDDIKEAALADPPLTTVASDRPGHRRTGAEGSGRAAGRPRAVRATMPRRVGSSETGL